MRRLLLKYIHSKTLENAKAVQKYDYYHPYSVCNLSEYFYAAYLDALEYSLESK